ncbi:MAG TPA: hypothetical protein VHD87_12870 [Acidimicrobiales bacterium]|nr:hypothetical protein [Acidimicrobiales bacterium]
MADYYTQFSFLVPDPPPEAVEWFRRFVGVLDTYFETEEPAQTREEAEAELEMARAELAANPSDPDAAAAVAAAGDIVEFWDALPDHDYVGYEIEVSPSGEVWICGGESGEPSNVMLVLSEYLARFRPADSIFFEWANTCSRQILDSFSGGGLLVTAEGGEWFTPEALMLRAVRARVAQGEASDADRPAWVAAVASGITNLGFGDWLVACAEAARALAA